MPTWRCLQDAKSGKVYYANTKTRKVTWKKPPGYDGPDKPEPAKKRKSSKAGKKPSSGASAGKKPTSAPKKKPVVKDSDSEEEVKPKAKPTPKKKPAAKDSDEEEVKPKRASRRQKKTKYLQPALTYENGNGQPKPEASDEESGSDSESDAPKTPKKVIKKPPTARAGRQAGPRKLVKKVKAASDSSSDEAGAGTKPRPSSRSKKPESIKRKSLKSKKLGSGSAAPKYVAGEYEKIGKDHQARYKLSAFGKEHFQIHRKGFGKKTFEEMFIFQEGLIKKPLRKDLNPKTDAPNAVQTFKNLTSFSGDRKSKKPPVGHIQKLCGIGLTATEELRDEIYCQLVKQTRSNPSPESLFMTWKAMCLCLLTFPPAETFVRYLACYLYKVAYLDKPAKITPIAQFCVRQLDKIMSSGVAKSAPSEQTINTVEQLVKKDMEKHQKLAAGASKGSAKKPEPKKAGRAGTVVSKAGAKKPPSRKGTATAKRPVGKSVAGKKPPIKKKPVVDSDSDSDVPAKKPAPDSDSDSDSDVVKKKPVRKPAPKKKAGAPAAKGRSGPSGLPKRLQKIKDALSDSGDGIEEPDYKKAPKEPKKAGKKPEKPEAEPFEYDEFEMPEELEEPQKRPKFYTSDGAWKSKWDKESERFYFHNKALGKTKWKLPKDIRHEWTEFEEKLEKDKKEREDKRKKAKEDYEADKKKAEEEHNAEHLEEYTKKVKAWEQVKKVHDKWEMDAKAIEKKNKELKSAYEKKKKEKMSIKTAEGKCCCGGVVYTFKTKPGTTNPDPEGAPYVTYDVETTVQSGILAAAFVPFKGADVKVTKGSDSLTAYQTKAGKRQFCKKCGTVVFIIKGAKKLVAATTMNDKSLVQLASPKFEQESERLWV